MNQNYINAPMCTTRSYKEAMPEVAIRGCQRVQEHCVLKRLLREVVAAMTIYPS